MHLFRASRRTLAATIIASASIALDGCATAPVTAPPLSADASADQLEARSLKDPGLHRFLVENLNRDPGAWDFEALSWVSFYYHPSLAVARSQWVALRSAQKTAASRTNPTVVLTPGFTTTLGETPWLPAVGISFPFESERLIAQRTAVQEFAAEAARLEIFSSAWKARSDLRTALVEAATAERRLPILRQQTETQQRLVTLLTQRLAAGAIAAPALSTARAALIKAEAASADAQRQNAVARGRLAAALGVPLSALDGVRADEIWSLSAAKPPLSGAALAAARRVALRSRADILGALARYESSRATLQLEATRRRPTLNLSPQWEKDNNKWTLAFAFEAPLFHPTNEGPLAEAEAQLHRAAMDFLAVQAQVLSAIDAAVASQSASATQLEQARRLRTEVEKQAASAQQRFDLGAADQVELQTARLELAIADGALLDAENAAALTVGQLEDALQVPFPNLTALANDARAEASPRSP